MQLAIQTRSSWRGTLEAARWAENRGLAAFAMPDHYLRRASSPEGDAYDHLVHLSALAAMTSSIDLVSLVSPVTFRHPAVLYKMGVTIDEISGGRFVLGVGTGWLDEEFELFGLPYPPTATRYEMLEECLAYLRAANRPGSHSYSGEHYRLAEFDPHPHASNLRLLVGGGGKTKTPRLAGAYADEYNIYACPPAELESKLLTARDAAVTAGRDPSSMFVSTAGPALAAVDEDEYRHLLEKMAELTGNTPEHIESTYRERGWPHGPGSQAAEMVAALEDAGCQRYYLQMFGEGGPDRFETIVTAFGG